MRLFPKLILLLFFAVPSFFRGFGQRTYKLHSVLATGIWYKLALSSPGVYKIDVPFLTSAGFSGTIPSGQLRIFGASGAMLPEANAGERIDDLEEVALEVADGGDGVINGADYVLFYAAGPHQWVADSANKTFIHKKNLYTDKAYYYLSVGGVGKRVQTQPSLPNATTSVTSYNERYYHELDSVNFLSGGKEWFGEEFGSTPGRTLSRSFALPLTDAVPLSGASITTNVVARSVNTQSHFDIRVNNGLAGQVQVPPISGGTLDPFAQQAETILTTSLGQNSTVITFTYGGGSFNAQGWLNWFRVVYRRTLTLPSNGQLPFRDWNSVGKGRAEFMVASAGTTTQVWDVSNPLVPVAMTLAVDGTGVKFVNDAQRLHEYVAFSGSYLIPEPVGRLANQDLHNTAETDYFIITYPLFLAQARRLALFHQQRDGLRTAVVTTEQVFNEFSGGQADPAAIRDFVKLYYDRYRVGWSSSPKYVLLFGKGSFDYKNRITNNTNGVPCYESVNSLDPLSSYTSDDFFGFLDDAEDINSGLLINTLDAGIGRIPARSVEEATSFVDKVESYYAAPSLGPWRNNLTFIADDEDFNLHLQDAEVITGTAAATAPGFTLQKIYLDAFRQEGGSAGGRYPGANEAINNAVYNGTLIWNYNGHGGPQRLAEEVVIDQQIVNSWNNANRLPLFITATCDFAPFDNPAIASLGENLLIRPKTGAVALMTTTRVVFAYSNRLLNNNYLQLALQPDSAGHYKSLGSSIQAAKNVTYQSSGDVTNNRKFSLLGDPAMTLGFPQLNVTATTVNGHNISLSPDTLSATETVQIQGEVRDFKSVLQPAFNGTVYLTLYDKPQTVTTLGNDAASTPVSFQTETSSLFKGKASVKGGLFSFTFKLPRDINYRYGAGKLSLYAQNGVTDGSGFSNSIIIGGISSGSSADDTGPRMRGYLNDGRFANGSITNAAPLLIVQLSDSSGINTGNAGIDHDIVATLDDNNRTYFILNDFYESELDSYQKGTVRFQLPELPPGPHTLKIKAWDVMNNSSEFTLEFTVVASDALVLRHILNYPNPFSSRTTFWFEHNMPGVELKVKVEIFTVTGKLVKTLLQTINNTGNRSSDIEWDGKDEFGSKVGRGVYLYRLRVQTPSGIKAEELQRLLIL